MATRRKVSSALADFQAELKRLRRLDDLNHSRFYPGPGRPGKDRLSKSQMYLLTEAIFTRAFSRYEEFIEQVFLLYCQGRPGSSGVRVGSYIKPRNPAHAKSMVKSGMTFIEWNAPDKILSRSETYLYPENPMHLAITTNQARLQNIRRVRNAIAHASEEAETQFRKVVRSELGVMPLRAPSPGEFLLLNDTSATKLQHYLTSYLDVLNSVAVTAAA